MWNSVSQYSDVQHTPAALFNNPKFGVAFYQGQDAAARANWISPTVYEEKNLAADLNKIRAQIGDIVGGGGNWFDKIQGTSGDIEAIFADGSAGVLNGSATDFALDAPANWTKEGGAVLTALTLVDEAYCDVYLNGRRLSRGEDYSYNGTLLVVNTTNLTAADRVVIVSRGKRGLTIT